MWPVPGEERELLVDVEASEAVLACSGAIDALATSSTKVFQDAAEVRSRKPRYSHKSQTQCAETAIQSLGGMWSTRLCIVSSTMAWSPVIRILVMIPSKLVGYAGLEGADCDVVDAAGI